LTRDERGSQADKLEMARAAGVEIPAHLLPPPCPEELQYILAWYYQLSATRDPPSLSGTPAAIRFSEMLAWVQLFGIRLTRFELNCLVTLDVTYRNVASGVKQQNKDGNED
jgi:hypothetical protein